MQLPRGEVVWPSAECAWIPLDNDFPPAQCWRAWAGTTNTSHHHLTNACKLGSQPTHNTMKCFTHSQTDAVASCVYCGHAMCPSCVTPTSSGRSVCSPRCADGAAAMEASLETIRQKTISSNRLAGYFCLVAGITFGGFGVYEISRSISSGSWSVVTLLPCCFAVVLTAVGIAMLRMLKSKSRNA